MTPDQIKQKADELINSFKNIDVTLFGCEEDCSIGNPCIITGKMLGKAAKQCALILCDDVKSQLLIIFDEQPFEVSKDIAKYIAFWNEVKTYIENNY